MVGSIVCRLTLALTFVAMAACQTQTTGEPWSTKMQSVDPAPAYAPPETPNVPAPAGDLRNRAIALLHDASRSEQGQIRANAIEAMQQAPESLEPLVRRGIADSNRGVRFAAAITVGQQRMTFLAHLLYPLLEDESGSVRAAAMFGLERCGERVDLTPLASLVRSEDPEVRANAAMVLGKLGNPTALPVLRSAVGRGMERVVAARVKMVDLQLAEAMVRLGDDRAIEGIRAALFAPPDQGEITALAAMICGRLEDQRAVPNLERLALLTDRFQQPAEVRMAACWALAQIDSGRAPIEVPLAYVDNDRYQLRAQAALTLGQIGDPGQLPVLASMMADSSLMVRVAAAGGILAMTGEPSV
jgi:HEAT repeat protein